MAGYLLLLFSAALIKGSFGIKVSLKENVVKEGDPIEFLCHIQDPVHYCRIVVPGGWSYMIEESKASAEKSYFGNGFAAGDCGIKIHVAKQENNGEFLCGVTPVGADTEITGKANLTVAKSPTKPELRVTPPERGNDYKEGDTLFASCTVKNGRPVANITWYIGDEKVTDGLSQPERLDFKPQDLYSIEQNLTRRVQASDHGKELKCVATHPLLNKRQSTSSKMINVIFPPKETSQPLERFGLVEGEEGKILVTVMANPKPMFTWVVGDEQLGEGQQDQSGRITAQHGLPSPNDVVGSWDSVLVINQLKSDDVEKKYELIAKNDLGEHSYKVVISTSPEPKMLELGAGAIIGIVVAVLVLLTLAAVILFARAKGRWCFGGASAQLAGESSDTESADHTTHPKIKKTPFTSVFKKKTEKTPTDEAQPKEAGEEEKEEERNEAGDMMLRPRNPDEGVVYAELDLNLAPGARPTPTVRSEEDKTEYAEIIHLKESNSDK